MVAKDKPKRVAVLLASYNGAAYLPMQLQSLADQSHSSIDVWLSDDGSTDGTVDIARKYASTWTKGAFNIQKRGEVRNESPGQSIDLNLAASNLNFHSLATNPEIAADYYAYCDQDDVWEYEKLERAVSWLEKQAVAKPALYCSRTTIINERGEETGRSIQFAKPPAFSNAVIQNIAAGNTIVMNQTAFDAVRNSMVPGEFVSHDWWAYIVVTAMGGVVKYDPCPTLRYRQHDSNLVGENASWRARMIRLRFVMEGRFAAWNETNLKGLDRLYPGLEPDKQAVIDSLRAVRGSRPFQRLAALHRSKLHRQTGFGQISLYLACLLGKI